MWVKYKSNKPYLINKKLKNAYKIKYKLQIMIVFMNSNVGMIYAITHTYVSIEFNTLARRIYKHSRLKVTYKFIYFIGKRQETTNTIS